MLKIMKPKILVFSKLLLSAYCIDARVLWK